jgi:diadenosine tetraphosphate (Ap4A) HIT family hydrolase
VYVTDCEFCQQFLGAQTPLTIELDTKLSASSILLRGNGVITMAGVGPLTPGYALISPEEHYYSLGELPDVLLAEVTRQKEAITDILTHEFGSAICFEHGAINSEVRGGSCIDHAHLHIIQGFPGFRELISKNYAEVELEDMGDLKRFVQQGKPYLFIQDVDGCRYAYDIPNRIPSQYLRRIWARAVGRPKEWDWELFPNYELMNDTIKVIGSHIKKTHGIPGLNTTG